MKFPLLTLGFAVLLMSTAQARQSTTHNSIDLKVDSSRRLKVSKFQIGLSLGGMYNSTFAPDGNQPYYKWMAPNKSSATIALKGIYAGKRWRYGLSLEHSNLAYSVRDSRGSESTYWENALSAIHSKVSIDRALTHGKRELYCGATAGALVWNKNSKSFTPWPDQRAIMINYSLGIQTGLTYHINEVVHFNAQLSADYANIEPRIFLYSASVGLRFSIHRRVRG